MTAQALASNHGRESLRRAARRNGLVQLGWPQFWLLGGILAGILSMVVAIIFALLVLEQ